MYINVGTTNPSKIAAVTSVFGEYSEFRKGIIRACKAESMVSDQPLSLREIIAGARNRARAVFERCDFSVGLESGFIEVPYSKTGMMVTSACVLFDGNDFHMGLSPAFECPEVVMRFIREGKNLNEAILRAGLTEDPALGSSGGAVGLLTKGHVLRADYLMPAIRFALIPLQNKELYLQ